MDADARSDAPAAAHIRRQLVVLTFGAAGQDLWPLSSRCRRCELIAMTDQIVIGDRVVLEVGFDVARARLGIMARDAMLQWASEVAYGESITGLVMLAGRAAGLTRLAGIRLGDLAQTHDRAHIALRWEAIAADGKLFTALDADLMLAPAGDQITALALAGAFRLQPGRACAGLDREIIRGCAATAIGSFMAQVADMIVHPAGTTGHAGHTPTTDLR